MRKLMFILLFLAQDCGAGEVTVTYEKAANESYALSQQQEKKLAEDAMSGDANAALQLTDRYFFDLGEGRKYSKFRELALKWAVIGSENGSAKAQFRAYQLMQEHMDPLIQARALFWLQRSAQNGFEDAQIILRACPNIDAKYSSGTPCFGPEDRPKKKSTR